MATQTKPLVPGAAVGASEVAESGGGIVARGYWSQAWRRFRRDRLAVVSGVVIILIFFTAFIGAPLAVHILGHGPNDIVSGAVDKTTFLPVGPWTTVATGTGHQTT